MAEFPDVTEHISPWCAIFSEENLKVMEFVDDLIFYQIGGYGNDINWKMTKPLVTELQERFLEMRYATATHHTRLNMHGLLNFQIKCKSHLIPAYIILVLVSMKGSPTSTSATVRL